MKELFCGQFYGIVNVAGLDLWFKTETLPTGWGDFMIIQCKNAKNEAKRIYERKTVADLKSSISKADRHEQFNMFCGTAEKENILATIILETAASDRFLKPPQFTVDLKEHRPDDRITNYNCRAFLNSLPCGITISASIIETAIFLYKEIQILLNLNCITKLTYSDKNQNVYSCPAKNLRLSCRYRH